MLTRAGVGTAIASISLLVAGGVLNYPELVVAGVAGTAGVTASLVAAVYRPRVGLAVSFGSDRVVQGAPVVMAVTLTNNGRLPRFAMTLQLQVAPASIELDLEPVPARTTLPLSRELPAFRRGVYSIPPPQLRYRDLFGFARPGLRRGEPVQLVVYPSAVPVASLPGQGPTDLDGRPQLSAAHGGDSFYSLRPYVPGDDWRKLHWASVAHRGTLLVRHTTMPEETSHLVVLDVDNNAYAEGRFEEAVKVAASLCEASLAAGDLLTLHAGKTVQDESGVTVDSSTAMLLLAQVQAVAPIDQLDVTVPDGAFIAVVTGRPETPLLHWLEDVRTASSGRYLVQVLDAAQEPVEVPAGVRSVVATDVDDFSIAWTRGSAA